MREWLELKDDPLDLQLVQHVVDEQEIGDEFLAGVVGGDGDLAQPLGQVVGESAAVIEDEVASAFAVGDAESEVGPAASQACVEQRLSASGNIVVRELAIGVTVLREVGPGQFGALDGSERVDPPPRGV
ncbi:hypothetical protein [Longispora fulva]|uniref:Uncharacterized protein n=1 Tax=Longispora fulva TaxID=619741 RepID=A0A8J7G6S5_9ACTN|nr:hypothetical protein [Longispora fulva]MBG6133970.1 hypothetical protein [Longispora fulva]